MAKKIKARVLADVRIDGVLYRSDSAVLEIDVDVAKSFIKDGALDDSPAAVAYALGDGGLPLVKHVEPVVTEVQPTDDPASPVA